MNAWAPVSSCTAARCVGVTGGVPRPRALRRYAALASALTRTAAHPGRLDTEPGRLRDAARRVLDALGVTLAYHGAAPPGGTAPAPGGDDGRALLSVPGVGTGTLVVANHLSWLDVIALLAVEPAPLLAKREVARWPVIGPLAHRAGTRFIDRDGLRTLPDTVDAVAGQLRAGTSLVVFPEGTTRCSAPGGAFRRATFEAALRARAAVRPVALGYTRHGAPSTAAAFVGDDTFLASLYRVAHEDGLTVHVTACPPLLPPYEDHDRRSLAAAAREAVTQHGAARNGAVRHGTAVRGAAWRGAPLRGAAAGEAAPGRAGGPRVGASARQTAAAPSPPARRSAPALGVAPRPDAHFGGMVRRHEGCQ